MEINNNQTKSHEGRNAQRRICDLPGAFDFVEQEETERTENQKHSVSSRSKLILFVALAPLLESFFLCLSGFAV